MSAFKIGYLFPGENFWTQLVYTIDIIESGVIMGTYLPQIIRSYAVVCISKKQGMHCLPYKNYSAQNQKYLESHYLFQLYHTALSQEWNLYLLQWIPETCKQTSSLTICTYDMQNSIFSNLFPQWNDMKLPNDIWSKFDVKNTVKSMQHFQLLLIWWKKKWTNIHSVFDIFCP